MPGYKEKLEDTTWSMSTLNAYLNGLEPAANVPQDWVFDVLPGKIKAIMRHVIACMKGKLDQRMGIFDFLGLDFLIDTELNVWLLECNVNPALHTNTVALAEVIPPAVETALNIAVEVFEKQVAGSAVLPLATPLGSFEALKPVR
jgi:hypothetical protein